MNTTNNLAAVLRRMIGKVDIFDMSGAVKGDRISRMHDYIQAYVKQGQIKYAIINIQDVSFIDNNSVEEMLSPLKDIERTVLYYDNEDLKNIFQRGNKGLIDEYCRTEKAVVDILGEHLINMRAQIPYKEKRSVPRLKSAIATDVIYKLKNGHEDIITRGLITNISEKGAFVEYLDLHSASALSQIDYFKDIDVRLNPSDNVLISQNMAGEVVRVEMSGKQTSIAIRFLDDISLASLY
jgi:hypothetical protein